MCTRKLRLAVDYLGVFFVLFLPGIVMNWWRDMVSYALDLFFFFFSLQLERSKPNKYPSKSEVRVELLAG